MYWSVRAVMVDIWLPGAMGMVVCFRLGILGESGIQVSTIERIRLCVCQTTHGSIIVYVEDATRKGFNTLFDVTGEPVTQGIDPKTLVGHLYPILNHLSPCDASNLRCDLVPNPVWCEYWFGDVKYDEAVRLIIKSLHMFDVDIVCRGFYMIK